MLTVKVDTHTHTLASVHAYSTLWENMQVAQEKGLTGLVVTDHAPGLGLGDTFPKTYFGNMRKAIPQTVEGFRIFKGVEANILDYDGNLDLPTTTLQKLDVVIASCHRQVVKPTTLEQQDQLWLKVAHNPYVDIIGHPGDEQFRFSFAKVLPEFKKYHKIVEINSSSFPYRQNARHNCREIALLCKKYQIPITVSSDAHFCTEIGNFQEALAMLTEIDFPQKLIMNRDVATLTAALPHCQK
ncbi:phosphatase [Lactobacillus sp. DCY120]|uniref:Phosphatase n=1 Tax=Bombilactobacillus apium TaxID=2675299 RepID=A0A850QZN5_9LACO|nr:phosphatase [Bombilactobacillus apium]NVY96249.1 phosphatase [Bombilactobacillus apium]